MQKEYEEMYVSMQTCAGQDRGEFFLFVSFYWKHNKNPTELDT